MVGGGCLLENMPLPPANCHLRKNHAKKWPRLGGIESPERTNSSSVTEQRKQKPGQWTHWARPVNNWRQETHYITRGPQCQAHGHPCPLYHNLLSCQWVPCQGEGAFPPQGPHKLSRRFIICTLREKIQPLLWTKSSQRTFPQTDCYDLGAPGWKRRVRPGELGWKISEFSTLPVASFTFIWTTEAFVLIITAPG